MSFPEGDQAVLGPGVLATIAGRSFYRLRNTGEGPLVMFGNRSGFSEKTIKVEHGTGKIIDSLAAKAARGF